MKQATIFGAYCTEKPNMERCMSNDDDMPYTFWSDADFDKTLGLAISIALLPIWSSRRWSVALLGCDEQN
jgi:hypothetical protein